MDATLYFVTRAFFTLFFFTLLAFGAGLWLGWIRWFHWQKESVLLEADRNSLASTVGRLSDEVKDREQLRRLVGEFKEANDHLDAEVIRLTTSLHAAKRNQEDIENIWRRKLGALQEKHDQMQIVNAPEPIQVFREEQAVVGKDLESVFVAEIVKPLVSLPLVNSAPRSATTPVALAAMEEASAAIARMEQVILSADSAVVASEEISDRKLINFPSVAPQSASPEPVASKSSAIPAFPAARRKRKGQRVSAD